MKKSVITITSALFALSAMAQEDISNVNWDMHITTDSNGVSGSSKENVWIESGSISGDIYGGTNITKIGNENGTGPTTASGKKFRGAELGFNATEEGSASVYIYGGTFNDKVSAVHYSSSISYTGTLNKRTGNMYIYGGTFNSDITGVGMAQSGNHTANTNVQVLGKLSMGTGMGVYGGISGGSGKSGNLFGNTNVTVSGNGEVSFVAGGNRMASNITGNVSVNVKDGGTVGAILGGNHINESVSGTSTITGNVSTIVDGGNVGTISSIGSGLDSLLVSMSLNGIVGAGSNTSVSGISKIEIKGNSKVEGGIVAGSAGWGTTSIGSTEINIAGGNITATGTTSFTYDEADIFNKDEIQNAIYAGSIAVGKHRDEVKVFGKVITAGIHSDSVMTINNGTKINITGGTIAGDIYGGGYAEADKKSTASMTVNGGSQIVVDAQNDISISGNIYGGGNQGSNGTSVVNGGTNVVFSNSDGNNIAFTGVVSGNGLNGAVVNGEKVFSFENYNGAFGGTIQNFDIVNINTSNLTGVINLSSTASNVFVNGASSIDNVINGMTSITINKDAVLTIENSSLLDGVNIVNNGKLVITNIDAEKGVEVKGELVVEEVVSLKNASEESTVIVKAVENVTETFVKEDVVESYIQEFVDKTAGEVVKAAAFDFDVVLEQGESVTLSFEVGDIKNFKILHESNGVWSEADDVTNVKYENGVLSFDVSHFSGYGYIATIVVPEPAEWAMIFGGIALGLAIYRRRK